MKTDPKTRAQVEGLLMLAAKRNQECEQIRDMVVELLDLGDWESGRDHVNDAIWGGAPWSNVDSLFEHLEAQAKRDEIKAAAEEHLP